MKGLWNNGPIVDQANVAITGGTGVPIILTTGGIPIIGLSTGSVAAGGAISGITALPAVYPDAYCYFPASKLATSGQGSTAGLYYCAFSTTTAGVAFLNSYTSGTPTIPASPTAVTNGQGAFTGDTGEEFGLTLTVPVMTAKSSLRVSLATQNTNNANAKTLNMRLSGNAGTILLNQALASQASTGLIAHIANTGSVAKQIAYEVSAFGVNAGGNGNMTTVDLSLGTATLVFSLTRATATDNVVLLPATVEALSLP